MIAEGIEHAAQRDELERLGCERGLGYLFCRPICGTISSPPCAAAALVGA